MSVTEKAIKKRKREKVDAQITSMESAVERLVEMSAFAFSAKEAFEEVQKKVEDLRACISEIEESRERAAFAAETGRRLVEALKEKRDSLIECSFTGTNVSNPGYYYVQVAGSMLYEFVKASRRVDGRGIVIKTINRGEEISTGEIISAHKVNVPGE